jgi:ArsR family transcriptional regulator
MEKHTEYALMFKALSDETRLKIVEMLSCGEMCACDILESFSITQPTLSYHLKTLIDSGIINSRKDGSWIRYSINEEKVTAISKFWNQITTNHENCICKECKTKCK